MSSSSPERDAKDQARALACQAFSRAAGAPLVDGNQVVLLKDAQENYPAWLRAIAAARRYVHFENYIVHDDAAGRMFADALIAAARRGVRVRVIYDWVGGFRTASRQFWKRLRAGAVEVRCYNPPRWDSPFGWLSRDHRKTLAVDGEVAFVSGLCVGQMWIGTPNKGLQPWRDTGVEVRGPAVATIEQAFATIWAMLGAPVPSDAITQQGDIAKAGQTSLRVVASTPGTAGLLRINELVASLAVNHLWITDAYFVGSTAYVQALSAAAKDGVDVRLLVPNATDIPLLKSLSRAGYRPLLQAGVRVFEWNGTMIHAKTSVADTRWARVGSTNLNLASWFGNCELDVVIEDEAFARLMEESYLEDLGNATELVLGKRGPKPSTNRDRALKRSAPQTKDSSIGQAATGAVRLGNAVGAAFMNRRVLEPADAKITFGGGVVIALVAIWFALLPRTLAYPVVFALAWIALSLLRRAYKLHRAKSASDRRTARRNSTDDRDAGAESGSPIATLQAMATNDPFPPFMTDRSPSIERARREYQHPAPVGDSQIVAVLSALAEREQNASAACSAAASAVKAAALATSLSAEADMHATRMAALGELVRGLGGSPLRSEECRQLLAITPSEIERRLSDDDIDNALQDLRRELGDAWTEAQQCEQLNDEQRTTLRNLSIN